MRKRARLMAAAGAAVAVPLSLLAPQSPLTSVAAEQVPGDTATNGLIAYSAGNWSGYYISVIHPDSTEPRNITNTPEVNEYDPSWSPDGTRIAFTRDTLKLVDGSYWSDSDLFVMDADGTNEVQLTSSLDPEFQPDWA